MADYKLWNALKDAKKYRWVELSHSLNNESPYWSGIHLPALSLHHGGQKPLGTPQKLLGLVGCVQDLHLRDAAVSHGDLYSDGTAVAPGRADVNAVGIGQLGQGFFLRFGGSGFHRLLHHGCQLFRHGGQHRNGAGQGKKYSCRCRHRREQLHQRQQCMASFLFIPTPPDTEKQGRLMPSDLAVLYCIC